MAIWRHAESGSAIEGQVVRAQVLPPSRYVARGFSRLACSIGLVLFFVLRTFRPVVRIALGLVAGFTIFGCIISFLAAWYQNWPANLLWVSGGMFAVATACSALLWYYDLLLLKLTPHGVDLVVIN